VSRAVLFLAVLLPTDRPGQFSVCYRDRWNSTTHNGPLSYSRARYLLSRSGPSTR
jgi:hypothetical protein